MACVTIIQQVINMSPAEEPQYEISQDEEVELWALLSQVRKELLTASDRELRRFGVSTVQLGILHALNNAYEAGVSPSLSDLSRWVIRQHNTVSVILGGMEKRGLVELDRTSQRKRTLRINITEKGRDLYAEHMKNRKNIPQILGSLSLEERDQLRTLLRKLDQKSRDILFKSPF
jgi:DNA-binding MarR family transcriptional regulator